MIGPRIVEVEKITGYLLDESHPEGAAKARFFMRFGFDRADVDLLQHALLAHPDVNDIANVTRTRFGVRTVVECHFASLDGRDPCIRTVWFCEHGADRQRLVTAYPITPA